ncbi:hypothetical protein AB0A74_02675 [Saccharothrix sp. NPDC042600]|uniref:Cupin 2 conserved barrel domain-containing protein n=1 Tax=Saccharothrix mutabilis subsp. mutabilis TaxID=66855 RepID=A0ABN0T1C1_9PSEU|nr:hypothetical protein GCM10017745_66840 [Saccharothrix mutabilis subsp. capreolus]
MSDESRKIAVQRLYHDESGESHFVDEMLEVVAQDFAPPAPPFYVSAGVPAKQAVYLFLPAGYVGDFHPAPRRQLMTLISGDLESRVSDGESRRFVPGNTMLVEDTEGKGHWTKAHTDCTMIVSQLE